MKNSTKAINGSFALFQALVEELPRSYSNELALRTLVMLSAFPLLLFEKIITKWYYIHFSLKEWQNKCDAVKKNCQTILSDVKWATKSLTQDYYQSESSAKRSDMPYIYVRASRMSCWDATVISGSSTATPLTNARDTDCTRRMTSMYDIVYCLLLLII